MNKLMDMMGLQVLDVEMGKQIGTVSGAVLDFKNACVEAFVVRPATWFADEKVIRFEEVHSIGQDAIMAPSKLVLCDLSAKSAATEHYYLHDVLGKPVYTDTGSLIGVLCDVYFNRYTGEITGYQLSDGIITDLLYGRFVMPLPQAQLISSDKVIVSESMAKLLHADNGC